MYLKNKFFYKTSFILILLFLTLTIVPVKSLTAIPTGTWKYNIYINNSKIGEAILTNIKKNNKFIHTFEIQMNNFYSKDTIIETLDCKPIKLIKTMIITANNTKQKTNITADYKNNYILLKDQNNFKKIKLNSNFTFDGNYLLLQLIKNNFKKNLVITYNIYDPTIEQNNVIPIKSKIVDQKKLKLNNQIFNVWEINTEIAGIKNIKTFIDQNGVMIKSTIKMMNLTMDIILTKN